jgi:hypothetical protein
VANRHFQHKITSHSGKTEEELRLEMAARKLSHKEPLGNLRSLPKYIFKEESRLKAKEKLLSPKDLSSGMRARDFSIDLSFIDKIVSPEDNDQKYLGDYEIERYYSRRGEETAVSSVTLKRKDSIVENIRKRIQQIENHESSLLGRKIQRRRYNPY